MSRLAIPAAAALAVALGASPFRAEHAGVREANARAERDPAGALALYDRVERETGPRAELDLARGDALFRLGRLDEAERAFELAAGRRGTVGSKGAQNLGHARLARGDEEGALAALRGALDRDPANGAARHDLEVLLRRRAEEERAGADGGPASVRAERRPSGGGPESSDPDLGQRPSTTPPLRGGYAQDERGEPDERGEQRHRPDQRREPDGREGKGGRGHGPPAMSRAEAERLLDSFAASERPLPSAPAARRRRGAKDW